ncbi:MAG TPA: hypothetical protein VGJ84_05950 [Polyangiaceae bacterium]|jgi:hypothetical protein
MTEPFRVCSICRKPIPFEERYYRCSVSTCNQGKSALFFCSVACFEAHVPDMRHKDAWAEQATAPSREAWEASAETKAPQNAVPEEGEESGESEERTAGGVARRVVTTGLPAEKDAPAKAEVLVVVSKLKQYIRERAGMKTSDAVAPVLSDHLRALCDRAIRSAAADGRKTVLDRDFPGVE